MQSFGKQDRISSENIIKFTMGRANLETLGKSGIGYNLERRTMLRSYVVFCSC